MLLHPRAGLALGLLTPLFCSAAPFSPFEARGFGMGGAGVASAEHAAATLYNPALLAVKSDSKRFSFIAPSIGMSATGNNGAVDSIQQFNDHHSLDGFNNAANAYNTALNNYSGLPSSVPNQTALQNASNSLQTASDLILKDLQRINNKAFQLGAGGSFALAIPRGENRFALSLSSEFFGRATTEVTASDLTLIGTTVSTVTGATAEILANNGNTSGALASQVIDQTTGELKLGGDDAKPTSRIHILGATVTDLGVSMARQLEIQGHTFMLGITPKLQHVATVAVIGDADTDTIKFNDQKKTSMGFNLDVGLAKQFDEGTFKNVRVGLVIRNLIPRSYATMDATQKVKISPQMRTGIAYLGSNFTVTSDLDLTPNKVVGQGKEQSQYLAIGGEVSAWSLAKLRLGYREDFKSKYGALTAGVSLFGVQLSMAYAQDREASAILQFSGSF